MSPATLERPTLWGDGPPPWELAPPAAGARGHLPGHGPTLDSVITGLWEALCSGEAVDCPACGGDMVARPGHGAAWVGGACRRCGTLLA